MYPKVRLDALTDAVFFLIVSSVAAIAWSFLSPRHALWVLALNLAAPALTQRKRKNVTGCVCYKPSAMRGCDQIRTAAKRCDVPQADITRHSH